MQKIRFIIILLIFGCFIASDKELKTAPKSKISKTSKKKMKFSNVEDAEPYLETFRNAFLHLREHYVDSLNESEIIRAGIKGMFNPLDKYTLLLSKDGKESLDRIYTGKYGGIGISMGPIKDTLTVLSVSENAPAYSEGLIPGDQILMVDSTSTHRMRVKDVSNLIKGEVGTTVDLHIRRPSTKVKKVFTLERSDVKLQNIHNLGIDKDGIGYIKINRFSKGISQDFLSYLDSYDSSEDLRGIIIDVRSNKGGLLSESIKILDLLTHKGDTLLERRGKRSSYHLSRRRPVIGTEYPIVILQNKKSASASEILAGVLQDLDRAVVVGERSFGKGLVQNTKHLNDTTSIKITTAKFYTPSGRLIQENDYMSNGFLTDRLGDKDSLFYTTNGRIVKGGGGIAPDYNVKSDKIPGYISKLWQSRVFTNFVSLHIEEYKDYNRINARMLKKFNKYLKTFELSYKLPGETYYTRLNNEMSKYIQEHKDEFTVLKRISLNFKRALSNHLLKKYFNGEHDNQFWFDENLRWIENSLEKEFAYQISLDDRDRIRYSLKIDNVYLFALNLVSDTNRYFDTLDNSSEIGCYSD